MDGGSSVLQRVQDGLGAGSYHRSRRRRLRCYAWVCFFSGPRTESQIPGIHRKNVWGIKNWQQCDVASYGTLRTCGFGGCPEKPHSNLLGLGGPHGPCPIRRGSALPVVCGCAAVWLFSARRGGGSVADGFPGGCVVVRLTYVPLFLWRLDCPG